MQIDTVKDPQEKRHDHDRYDTTDSLFSSSFSSSLFGDSIGMESCVDVLRDDNEAEANADAADKCSIRGCTRDRRKLPTEFPPPIPSLVRTENLLPRTLWVLRRHYTGDGRLVLTEEKAHRHEYFHARRSNGRLTLHLVPMAGDNATMIGNGDEENGCDRDRDENGDESATDGGDAVKVSRKSGSRCVEVGVGFPSAIRPVHG